MRVGKFVGSMVAAVTAVAGLVVVPGLVGEASAAPESCASVGDGWAKISDTIGDFVSPWMKSEDAVGNTRSIQFESFSGVKAQRCLGGKPNSETAFFNYASQYRTKDCKGAGCITSDWVGYTAANGGPYAGYRFPHYAAGWDPFAGIFRLWNM